MRHFFPILTFVLFFCLPEFGLAETPPARSFDSIEIVGNDRFRDGDILATSGLQTGVEYTENDLISAVESLDFTGEFKSVRIFSSGSQLTISVVEEPQYSGALTFGLGYESGTGVFGVIGLSLDDAFGNGTSVRARLSLADEYTLGSARFSNPSFWGAERAGGVRFTYGDYRYDDALFDYTVVAIAPYVDFRLSEKITGEFRISGLRTEIDNVAATASPIILSEAGSRSLVGPGVTLNFGDGVSGGTGWNLRLDQDLFAGDATLSRTELRFSGAVPVGAQSLFRASLELGAVQSLGGDETTAADRFTLGGASMRGFAPGGISPRDVCAGCGAGGNDIATDLGGNFYAVARTEVVLPLFQNSRGIEPYVFADVGTVWDVESDATPAGILDDSVDWRSSAGLGISIRTPLGRFAANFAPVINSSRFDDEAEFSILFTSNF